METINEIADQALAEVRALGLPPVFEEIWVSNKPRRFCVQWNRPRRFFEQRANFIAMCPRLRTCVPLLESNREHLVAFDTASEQYIEYYYGDSDCKSIGKGYQQLLSSVFIELGYSGLLDLVEEVSDQFRYRHLKALTEFIESETGGSAEQAKQAFIDAVSPSE
jgi:hypothetical protein